MLRKEGKHVADDSRGGRAAEPGDGAFKSGDNLAPPAVHAHNYEGSKWTNVEPIHQLPQEDLLSSKRTQQQRSNLNSNTNRGNQLGKHRTDMNVNKHQ